MLRVVFDGLFKRRLRIGDYFVKSVARETRPFGTSGELDFDMLDYFGAAFVGVLLLATRAVVVVFFA